MGLVGVILVIAFFAACGSVANADARADSAIASPSAKPPALAALEWLHDGADKVRALTESPGECLRASETMEAAYLVETGRAAFNSPLLFGGPAARSGLSCASCHVNGRDNPAFFLAGLSDAPGTADVTSSIFSATREDGVFNPAPIPSLVGAAGKSRFGARKPAASLHAFIEDAVIAEFQGSPPPQTVIDGLAAYIGHLDPAFCPAGPAARTPSGDLAGVERMLDAAMTALQRGEYAAADFLIASARHGLGRMHERYAKASLAPQRSALRDASLALSDARAVAANDPISAQAMLEGVAGRVPALAADLETHRRHSLYDVLTLRDALNGAAR